MGRIRSRGTARAIRLAWIAAALVGLAGCSTSNTQGTALVDERGNHPAGWLSSTPRTSTHPRFALQDVSVCTECHGESLTGGIAQISCFTAACHHGTFPAWSSPTVHGAAAKRAPGSSGFASCQICHGFDFSVALGGDNCFGCHGVNAPHPPGPWRQSGTEDTHTSVDPANVTVCALCHFGEPSAGNHPPVSPPAGSVPGCFNNTLCHGSQAPHPLGSSWNDPAVGGVNFHGATAKANLTLCQGCHGTPGTRLFDGGVAPTACSTCHAAAKAHPTDWQGIRTIGGAAITHRTATNPTNPTGQCALCHKVDGPGAGPQAGAPSCFSASFINANGQNRGCHSNGPGTANHSVPFDNATHFLATTTTFSGDCGNCHAQTGTSPMPSAPLCSVCHTNTAVNPLTTKNCASCHGNPPSGGSYPNVAGAHAAHLGLNSAGSPVSCATCHSGLGSGTLAHYNRANGRPGAGGLVQPGDVAFVATYNARSGSSSFDNGALLRCSNVSCHGGQATPNWRTDTIDVNAQCGSCHQLGDSTAGGSPQYNVYFSGRHKRHVVGESVSCTTCHSTASLAAVHFNDLSTAAMPDNAATINATALSFNGSANPPTCNPDAGGVLTGCHNQKSWTQENLP